MVGEAEKPGDGKEYMVVARRYRPKTFEELIGQDHISQALGHAIETGRVGHAYLFTGARGVGKTSTARIFAKVLNTSHASNAGLVTEISQAIDSVVFTAGAFLGVFDLPVVVEIELTTYLLKAIVALLDTPMVYIARRWRDRGIVPEEPGR